MRSERDLDEIYAEIPEGIDLLVTHGPPYGVLDKNLRGDHCGSVSLRERLTAMKNPPRVACFGHLHRHEGMNEGPVALGPTMCYNVSIMDESYDPTNEPVIVEL